MVVIVEGTGRIGVGGMELLERDGLLAALAARVEGARRREGTLVLLAGPAGSGKSSVARAALAAVPPGFRRWWGAHDPYATPRPYGPLHDVAEHDGVMRALLADPSSQSDLAVRIVRDLGEQPTMLVVEDVHWADDATVELLVHVGRRIGSTRSVVVLTYRPDEVDAASRRLLAALATADRVERMAVEPLSRAAVARLAEGTRHDVDQVLRLTGGNAFFVTEVLAQSDLRVPSAVADVVRARAAALSDDGRQLLELCSLAPGGLERAVATTILGEQVVVGGLDHCSSIGLLREERGRLLFRHELARLAVEESTPPGRRTARRRTLMGELEALPGTNVTRLVHHAEQLGDHQRVADLALLAAAEAEDRESWTQAAAHLRRALDADVDRSDRDRFDLLVRLAHAERQVTTPEAMIDRLHQVMVAAEAIGDVAQAIHQRIFLARGLRVSGRVDEAEAVEQRVLELLSSAPDDPALVPERIIVAGDFYAHRGLFSQALAMVDEARASTAPIPVRARAWAAMQRAHAAVVLDGPAKASDVVAEALVANERFSTWSVVLLRTNLAEILLNRGLLREAGDHVEGAAALAGQVDLWDGEAIVAHVEALAALRAGRHDQARRLARFVLDQTHLPARTYPLMAAATIVARVAIRTGDVIGDLLDRAWDAATGKAWDLDLVWPLASTTEEAALYGHDVSRHAARVEAAWRLIAESEDPASRGELLVRRPDLAGNITAEDVDEPWQQLAVGDWRGAAAVWQDRGCPFERAEALALGDETAVRDALGLFEEIGAVPAADRARARLRAMGVEDVPLRDRRSPAEATLTRRQLEVLTLVAEGLTDRQIADRLFLSPKTVGHHVSAVLERLAAPSRTAAVHEGRRRGLLPR
jgi:DNA-binding CsgD family transcriptional regulator/tetratricopeptide (TPR) repeat protein